MMIHRYGIPYALVLGNLGYNIDGHRNSCHQVAVQIRRLRISPIGKLFSLPHKVKVLSHGWAFACERIVNVYTSMLYKIA